MSAWRSMLGESLVPRDGGPVGVAARCVVAGTTGAAAVGAVLHRSSFGAVPVVGGAGVVAVAGVAVGTFLHRREQRPLTAGPVEPTWLLAAGLLVLVLTTAGVHPASAHHAGGAVRWAVASLPGYALVGTSLLRLITGRRSGRDADILVDAGLAATALGIGLWLAFGPVGHGSHLPVELVVVRVLLAALDLGLLTLVGRLLLLPGEPIAAYRYLGLGVGYLLGAHTVSVMTTFGALHAPPSTVPVLLVCAFGFTGLAGVDPSLRSVFEPLQAEPPAFSPGHTVVVCGSMLLVPLVVSLEASKHAVVSTTVAVAAALTAPVLAGYVASLLWDRARIERRAQHDVLTDLPNRSLFLDRVARAVAHARRNGGTVAVMFVDLDQFKEINDTFGHSAGDRVLLAVATRMRHVLRDEDTVARLGGDEFAILLPHVTDFDGVVTVTEKLMAALREPLGSGDERMLVTPSIGVAVFPQDGETSDDLLANADSAMYRAKERGRNTYEIFSPALRNQTHDRLAMEAALVAALERDELVVHYQPQVDLRSGKIVGAEALIRWQHPERGLLFPGAFVPVAERSDLIVALGEYVLQEACAQARLWQDEGLPPIVISVNASARQFRQHIADTTAQVLRVTNLDPRWLQLELTESTAIENIESTSLALRELRAMGVGCAIDDFGTGYCGLKYLAALPLAALKVDKSFVEAMTISDAAIVTAIINLGHALGLRVIAEGVETELQFECLVRQGCDEVQGFLFSKALPPEDFAALLRNHVVRGPGRLPERPALEAADEAPAPSVPEPPSAPDSTPPASREPLSRDGAEDTRARMPVPG